MTTGQYEVRDGSGRSAKTADVLLAFQIRKMMLDTGSAVAVVWDSNGHQVKSLADAESAA